MSIWKESGVAAITTVLSICLLLPSLSHATDITESLSVRGFYTLDITHSDSSGTVLPTPSGDPGPVDEGHTSYDGSLLGLQADYSLSDNLALTLQAISTRHTEDSYTPTVEWAYLNYDLGDDLHLRGGKMKLSLLQGTELRYVGFSRLWVRPLVPTSGAGGFDDYVGAELIKGSSLGNYNLRFQAAYGKAEHHRDFVDNRDIKLISSRIEKDESWINFALLEARYDVDTPSGVDIMDDAQLLMGSVETELLLGKTIINAGYAYGNAEINPDEQLAYLSLGYRFEKFTPYLLLNHRQMEFDASERPPPPGPPPPGPPPPPPLDGVHKTNTIAVGVRYDLGTTYAIKGQWDHWTDINESNPLSGNVESDGNLFTLVFEGVF